MASFADKYNIEIELSLVPQTDYSTRLSGMIASGQSPDLIVDNNEFPYLLPCAAWPLPSWTGGTRGI